MAIRNRPEPCYRAASGFAPKFLPLAYDGESADVIAAPSALVASMISRDPAGLIPRIFSWIPIYTPVILLARLESGVSSFELAGKAAVLLAFGVLELFALERLFEINLIQTGSRTRAWPPAARLVRLDGYRQLANLRHDEAHGSRYERCGYQVHRNLPHRS